MVSWDTFPPAEGMMFVSRSEYEAMKEVVQRARDVSTFIRVRDNNSQYMDALDKALDDYDEAAPG